VKKVVLVTAGNGLKRAFSLEGKTKDPILELASHQPNSYRYTVYF
jgi:hypothetical protein